LIVLDEAQTIKDIGKALKIIHDHIPQVQLIATGSSSFDLANKIFEPLTGRAIFFILYPFSIKWENFCIVERRKINQAKKNLRISIFIEHIGAKK
jgi:predicted AAA+ superfamily ATPase